MDEGGGGCGVRVGSPVCTAIGAVTIGAGGGAGASVGSDDGAGSTGAGLGLIGVAVPVGGLAGTAVTVVGGGAIPAIEPPDLKLMNWACPLATPPTIVAVTS